MNREEERRQVVEFYNGLRQYIKTESHGKLFGVQLHENWSSLSSDQQDAIISAAFIVSVERINQAAHDAIHGTEKPVRVNRRRKP